VKPDRIAECPLQIEAEVLAAHAPTDQAGAPPAGFHILETRARKVFARADLVVPGTQHVDPARWSPLLYVFRHYFGTGPDLGRTFRAEV
jgi:flavin reductase (DIM6/NTAB) family NADH-FMN oxidoreductase RutF